MKWLYLFLDGRGKSLHAWNANHLEASSAEMWRRNPNVAAGSGRLTVDLPGLFIIELSNNYLQVFIAEEYIEP